MQTLKDDVRENILQAALKEFHAKGYQDASMRSIAYRAGMTVGNLYRYFQNKDDLFYNIIGPVYNRLLNFVLDEKPKSKDAQAHINFQEYIVDSLVDIHKRYRSELLIIINGCTGTRYEKAREEFISLKAGKMLEAMINHGHENPEPFFAYVLAASYIEGLILIFKNGSDEKLMRETMFKFNDFYFASGICWQE